MADLRLQAVREHLRQSLWFLPAVSVSLSVVAALLASRVGVGQEIEGIGFGGTPEGARSLLSTVAGSTITVTSLTFSLTVVALQVASSQFSPRILGAFLSDRGNQAVLATFLGTFAFSLVTLRGVRGNTGDLEAFVPDVGVAIAMGMTALSVAMLVYFIHHLTTQLRVESILLELQSATIDVMRDSLPERTGEPEAPLPDVPDDALTLRADRAGYLQTLDVDRLFEVASQTGTVVRVRPRIGAAVTPGTTIAWIWPVDEATAVEASAVDELCRRLHRAMHVGFQRTMQQDVAFGVRQLVDIAVRALSPGINDPATAIATIGAVSPVFVELCQRRVGHEVVVDDQGRPRVAIDHADFGEILALACDQPRRYAGGDPAVLIALLEMLADIAELDPPDPEAVGMQIQVTGEAARSSDLSRHERLRVEAVERRTKATLDDGVRVAQAGSDDVEEPAG